MKNSNIPWLGEIPDDWEVLKGKNLLNLHKRSFSNNCEVITCFRDGEVTLRSNRRSDGFTFADKEIGYQGIHKGDLVIHGMDGFAGAIGISDSIGKGSPVLSVCTPKENNSTKFLMYYLRMLATQDVFIALATGIRERSCDLRWAKIADLEFILPPIHTQKAIADFLDKKCAEIDVTIEKTKTTIEKYKKLKQSIITEAVTKGLKQDVPMRDSGIEWIGEIPEEWVRAKIKNFTSKIGSGKTPKGGSEVYSVEGILFLRSQNIYNTGLSTSEAVYISDIIDNEMKGSRVFEDDVLLNITGGSIGRCCIYNQKHHANVNQHVCIIRVNKILPKLVFYFWTSFAGQKSIDIYQSGANREGLNFEEIGNTVVPIPPLEEQQEIVDFLDKKTATIDDIITKKEALLEKLADYKKSLIYEAVTGKMEV